MKLLALIGAMMALIIGLAASGFYLVLMTYRPPAAKPTLDIGALQAYVRISIPTQSIKWEMFREEEEAGMFNLGPVDYVKLVAEIVPADRAWFAAQPAGEDRLSKAGGASRSWLSPYFQALMNNHKDNWQAETNCKPHHTTMTKSDRPVDGFVCEHDGKLLLHIIVSD